jgi:uncharacterized membrane protein
MPTWLVALLVGLLSGLAGTLLRLQHERSADLRARMLEAADDFVTAFTEAREAIEKAVRTVQVQDSLANEEIPDDMRREWLDERKASISAAQDQTDALKRLQPRIELLFDRYSPAARSGYLAWIELSSVMHTLDRNAAPSPLDPEDERKRTNDLQRSDQGIREFSRRAREAILMSPWGVRMKARSLHYRAKRRLSRDRAPWGGDLFAPP